MERPIFFSLLIIIAAYLPLFTLERVERRLFTPMAFTVCYALLGSMLLALTLIPVLATYLFRKGAKSWENPVLRWLAGALCRRLLDRARAGAAVAGGAFRSRSCLRPSALARRSGSEFLPQLDEGVIWVRANLPRRHLAGQVGRRSPRSIRRSCEAVPEVKLVSSQTGRNDSGTDPYGPNRNEIFVALNPYDTWPQGMDQGGPGRSVLQRPARRDPGRALSFTQPIIDNVTEAVTGSPADLAVIISGPDLRELRRTGRADALAFCGRFRARPTLRIEQEADQAQLRIG